MTGVPKASDCVQHVHLTRDPSQVNGRVEVGKEKRGSNRLNVKIGRESEKENPIGFR